MCPCQVADAHHQSYEFRALHSLVDAKQQIDGSHDRCRILVFGLEQGVSIAHKFILQGPGLVIDTLLGKPYPQLKPFSNVGPCFCIAGTWTKITIVEPGQFKPIHLPKQWWFGIAMKSLRCYSTQHRIQSSHPLFISPPFLVICCRRKGDPGFRIIPFLIKWPIHGEWINRKRLVGKQRHGLDTQSSLCTETMKPLTLSLMMLSPRKGNPPQCMPNHFCRRWWTNVWTRRQTCISKH